MLNGYWCEGLHLSFYMRIGTGSEIFFSLERRCGGGFQKMVLRKNV